MSPRLRNCTLRYVCQQKTQVSLQYPYHLIFARCSRCTAKSTMYLQADRGDFDHTVLTRWHTYWKVNFLTWHFIHDDDGLVFYIPFNMILVISRWWKGDNEKLCAMNSWADVHLWWDLNPGPLDLKLEALTTRSPRCFWHFIYKIGCDTH